MQVPRTEGGIAAAWRSALRRVGSCHEAAADAVRTQRRLPHRLPGTRRRKRRSGLCSGLGLATRPLLGGAEGGSLLPAAGVVLTRDRLRQAWNRALRRGSGRAVADAGGADGRRPGGLGRRRFRARRRDGAGLRHAHCRALRGHVPGEGVGPRPLQPGRQGRPQDRRLSVGGPRRSSRSGGAARPKAGAPRSSPPNGWHGSRPARPATLGPSNGSRASCARRRARRPRGATET